MPGTPRSATWRRAITHRYPMKATTIHHQNRWIRGFSRVGLVLGLIAVIAVVGVGAVMVVGQYQRIDFDYEKLACLLSENSNRLLVGSDFKAKAEASRCGYFSSYDLYDFLQWREFGKSINKNGYLYVKTTDLEKNRAAALGIIWTMMIAAAPFAIVFLICWTTGWIFSGFAKSP